MKLLFFPLSLSLLLTTAIEAKPSSGYFEEESITTSIGVNKQESPLFSQAELEQMLAPIALYPDSLLTHILIASTYPLELVRAQRWLDINSDVPKDKILKKISKKDWDVSVKALVPFPRVLQNLNDDLNWTQQLGDAFLSNEEQVLASIQKLRHKAEQAGNLAKMTNSRVSYDDNNIVIESAQPTVVYVPYYDTRVVYGTWHWRHNPPVYWSVPRHLHTSHYYDSYSQPFYWSSGIHISFNFFSSAFHWHNRHIVVSHHYNKPFYSHSTYHRNRVKIVTSSGAKRWQHKPQHRRGVAYSNSQLKKRFHSTRKVSSKSYGNRIYASNHKSKTFAKKIAHNKKVHHVSRHKDKRVVSTAHKNKKVHSDKLIKQAPTKKVIKHNRKIKDNHNYRKAIVRNKATQKPRKHSNSRSTSKYEKRRKDN